jgi:hypothetical protein
MRVPLSLYYSQLLPFAPQALCEGPTPPRPSDFPKVGFGDVAADLREARFWTASGYGSWETDHGWDGA